MSTEAAAPPAPPPQAGDAVSKSIFNQARAEQGLDAPPVDTPPLADAPPANPPPPESASSAQPAVKTSLVPDDVIDPAKPAAAKVHEDVAEILAAELPKGAKKEQIESFGKLKTISAEKVQRALDRAAELEARIAKTTSPKELEDLTAKLTAAEQRAAQIEEDFAKVAYENSPKFKAQFVDQEKGALELARGYIEGTDAKPEIIDLAAHATGRKRLDLLKDAGIDDATISAILPHLAQFDTVQRQKQAALNNWRTEAQRNIEETTQRATQEKAKRTEQENKVWDQVISTIDLLPLRKSEKDAEWNTRAEQLKEEAKRIYNGEGADLPTFAQTILKGRAYDAQQEVVEHLRSEVTNLRAENQKLKSAAPGGALSAGTQDGQQVDQSKLTREQVSKSTFNTELAKAKAG